MCNQSDMQRQIYGNIKFSKVTKIIKIFKELLYERIKNWKLKIKNKIKLFCKGFSVYIILKF